LIIKLNLSEKKNLFRLPPLLLVIAIQCFISKRTNSPTNSKIPWHSSQNRIPWFSRKWEPLWSDNLCAQVVLLCSCKSRILV